MSLMMRGYTFNFAKKQAEGVDPKSLPVADDIFPGRFDGVAVPKDLLPEALATYKLGVEAEQAVAAATKARVVGNAKNRYWLGRSKGDVKKVLRKALDATHDHNHVASMFWYRFQKNVQNVPERAKLCQYGGTVIVAWPL